MLTHRRALQPLAALLLATTLAAQDPWARVPAMPTSCYAKDDEFAQVLTNASKELSDAVGTQAAINEALQKQVTADPVAMQAKLVAAMQKNPSQAGEIMGAFQKLGMPTTVEEAEAAGAKPAEFKKRAEKFGADFATDYNTLGPIHKRIKDHSHELGQTAQNEAIIKASWIEYNQKYETLCAKWFAREAPALLADYKQYLVSDYIPKTLEGEAGQRKLLEMFAVPTTTFKSVAALRAATMYLDFASGLYSHRRSASNMP